MAELSLVMPMAGRGARFADGGERLPKPLIEIAGRPFFWWATESVLRAVPVAELLFVVLADHVRDFAIDRAIRRVYPQARVLALPEVTAGAAATARAGVAALGAHGPVAVNDCDHGFSASRLPALVDRLAAGEAAAALLGFPSNDPAYSYVRFDGTGRVAGTVEKQVAGPFAIAGCYLFASPADYLAACDGYDAACPYAELFVSGLIDRLCTAGRPVDFAPLDAHVPFGTPAERAVADPTRLFRP